MSLLGLAGSYAVGWWLTLASPASALTVSGAALAAIGIAGAFLSLLLRRSAQLDAEGRTLS